MYQDFDDLRENCPAEIKADLAIDFSHADAEVLTKFWEATGDGEFRMSLVQRITDFWEIAVKEKGGDNIPEHTFAIEIIIDSYNDPEMGYSLYLEAHAYCGTEGVGDLCWSTFDDSEFETRFENDMPAIVATLLKRLTPVDGIDIEVGIVEIAEL